MITNQLQSVQRIDIIWDRYIPNSLKAQTRDKRGRGVRRRVESEVRLPANWGEFLKEQSKKTEMFQHLASRRPRSHVKQTSVFYLQAARYVGVHPDVHGGREVTNTSVIEFCRRREKLLL